MYVLFVCLFADMKKGGNVAFFFELFKFLLIFVYSLFQTVNPCLDAVLFPLPLHSLDGKDKCRCRYLYSSITLLPCSGDAVLTRAAACRPRHIAPVAIGRDITPFPRSTSYNARPAFSLLWDILTHWLFFRSPRHFSGLLSKAASSKDVLRIR